MEGKRGGEEAQLRKKIVRGKYHDVMRVMLGAIFEQLESGRKREWRGMESKEVGSQKGRKGARGEYTMM